MASFIPTTQLHDKLHNPGKQVSQYIFNRGFKLGADDFTLMSDLAARNINDHTIGQIKYPGFVNRTDIAGNKTQVSSFGIYGQFEILAHQTGNVFFVNTGIGYDGYGNRLIAQDRITTLSLTFPAGLPTGGSTPAPYGYLCVRRRAYRKVIAYLQHPTTCLPVVNDYVPEIEFYIAPKAVVAHVGGTDAYYPEVDSYGVIAGLLLGRVYDGAVNPPEVLYRSPILATRDGTEQPLVGFNIR